MSDDTSSLMVSENGVSITVKVLTEMTIYTASELLANVKAELQGLEKNRLIEIDLSEVAEMDTAGAQVLLMAEQMAASKGAALRVLSMSDAVKDSLKLLGLYCRFISTSDEQKTEKNIG